MDLVKFENEDKIKYFDELCKMFYERNFGQSSKSEIELKMFHFYMENLMKNKAKDNVVDNSMISDYRISQVLGITQQRIRNLKIKEQLVYPREFDWKSAFSDSLKRATYDEQSKKIILNIKDPNLYIEIENYIEEKGLFIEKQLNRKLLQIRVEYFLELVISFEDEKSKKQIIKELKKEFKKHIKDNSIFDEKHIGKTLKDCTIDVTSILANIHSLFASQNLVAQALILLLIPR